MSWLPNKASDCVKTLLVRSAHAGSSQVCCQQSVLPALAGAYLSAASSLGTPTIVNTRFRL